MLLLLLLIKAEVGRFIAMTLSNCEIDLGNAISIAALDGRTKRSPIF